MQNFYFSFSIFFCLFQIYMYIKYSFTSSKGFGFAGKYNIMFITFAACLRNEHKAIPVFFSPPVLFWKSCKQCFVYTQLPSWQSPLCTPIAQHDVHFLQSTAHRSLCVSLFLFVRFMSVGSPHHCILRHSLKGALC